MVSRKVAEGSISPLEMGSKLVSTTRAYYKRVSVIACLELSDIVCRQRWRIVQGLRLWGFIFVAKLWRCSVRECELDVANKGSRSCGQNRVSILETYSGILVDRDRVTTL
jgi:hypothetical protein